MHHRTCMGKVGIQVKLIFLFFHRFERQLVAEWEETFFLQPRLHKRGNIVITYVRIIYNCSNSALPGFKRPIL